MTIRAVEFESSLRENTTRRAKISLPSLFVLLFCCSLVCYVYRTRSRLDWREIPLVVETMRVAHSLALEGRYADPFAARTGYTAHLAPAYIFLLAAVFRGWGFGRSALRILWIANAVFISVQMALLPALSKRLGLGVLPGVLAAGLGILFAPYTVDIEWESLLMGVELVALCLLMLVTQGESCSRRNVMLAGLGWGIAFLTNPISALVFTAWAIAFLRSQPRRNRRNAFATFLAVGGVSLLVCAPWIVRNKIRLGSFFFIRDNLGLELSVSNNDCASPTLIANIESGCHDSTHPNRNSAIDAQIAAVGEYRFNQQRLRMTAAWIAQHPGRFTALTARRFALFWFPVREGDPFRRFPWDVWAITAFSVFGLVRLRRKNRLAAWLLGGALLVYPIIYYAVQFETRYREPILWVSLLLAGYGLTEVLLRVNSIRRLLQPLAE